MIPCGAWCIGKSVRWVAWRLGFYSRLGHTKYFKSSIRSFLPGVRRNRKCEELSVCVCCSTCLSSDSVQSFMINICNGPPIENGLHNVCLAPAVPYLYK